MATSKVNSVHALPMLVVRLLRCAALQVTPNVTSWHTRVQTTLSTKLAHALPTLVVMLWHARLQAISNVNSVHALPALVVLLTWCAALQATLNVNSVHALPVMVLALR
jgi:hypothetical protein